MSDPQVGQATFLRNAVLLDALAAYGAGLADTPPADVNSRFDARMVAFMESPRGRDEVMEWAALFARTLSELDKLRVQVVHRPDLVTLTDLEEGLLAQERALRGLRTWLTALSVDPHPEAEAHPQAS